MDSASPDRDVAHVDLHDLAIREGPLDDFPRGFVAGRVVGRHHDSPVREIEVHVRDAEAVAALLGLPGLSAYKAINTLDSVIGHRNSRYEAFGGFAARLDDLANLIPARLTGLVIGLASRRPAALNVMLRNIEVRKDYVFDVKKDTGRVIDLPRKAEDDA